MGFAACFLDHGYGFFTLGNTTICHHYFGTFLSKRQGDGLADP